MSLSYNGTEVQGVTYNGAEVQSITYNGVELWSGRPDKLFKLVYDGNVTSHVKDAISGTAINGDGTVNAAQDPFGGNNAIAITQDYMLYSPSSLRLNVPADSTLVFWANPSQNPSTIYQGVWPTYSSTNPTAYRDVEFINNSVGFIHRNNSVHNERSGTSFSWNQWHYFEISTEGNTIRIFIDGILKYQTVEDVSSSTFWKNGFYIFKSARGSFYDLCILDGVWHKADYSVPTAPL